VAEKLELMQKLRNYLRMLHMPRSLHWHHRVGRCLCELNAISPYGTKCVRTAAQELNQSHATFYRAMQFFQEYPGRAIQSLRGLTFAAVKVLLAIQDKALRQKMQQQAVEKHWSVKQLQREVNRRQGTRAARGGRKRKPGPKKTDLVELAKRSHTWLKYVGEVWPEQRLDTLAAGSEKQLVQHVREADRALQALVQSIKSYLPAHTPA
jgi:hypothetical protein